MESPIAAMQVTNIYNNINYLSDSSIWLGFYFELFDSHKELLQISLFVMYVSGDKINITFLHGKKKLMGFQTYR